MIRRAIPAVLASLVLLTLVSGCLFDSDGKEWAGPPGPLSYHSLRYQTPVRAGSETDSVEIGITRSNPGDRILWVDCDVRGDTIQITGEGRQLNGMFPCVICNEYRTLPLPSLEEGLYILSAGVVRDTLEVAPSDTSPVRRIAANGGLYPSDREGCVQFHSGERNIALSGVPDSLIGPGRFLVHMRELDEDPCGREDLLIDFYAEFLSAEPLE